MGLKRITFLGEAVFSAGDPRTLDELKEVARDGVRYGISTRDGLLAALSVTGASVDPDPEPVAEDAVPAPAPAEDPVT